MAVATDCDIDWVITNCLDEKLTTQAGQDANDVHLQIEELHSGYKQLTGIEKCYCEQVVHNATRSLVVITPGCL